MTPDLKSLLTELGDASNYDAVSCHSLCRKAAAELRRFAETEQQWKSLATDQTRIAELARLLQATSALLTEEKAANARLRKRLSKERGHC